MVQKRAAKVCLSGIVDADLHLLDKMYKGVVMLCRSVTSANTTIRTVNPRPLSMASKALKALELAHLSGLFS